MAKSWSPPLVGEERVCKRVDGTGVRPLGPKACLRGKRRGQNRGQRSEWLAPPLCIYKLIYKRVINNKHFIKKNLNIKNIEIICSVHDKQSINESVYAFHRNIFVNRFRREIRTYNNWHILHFKEVSTASWDNHFLSIHNLINLSYWKAPIEFVEDD